MRMDQLSHEREDLDRIVTLRPDYAGGYFLRGDVRVRPRRRVKSEKCQAFPGVQSFRYFARDLPLKHIKF